MAVEIVSEYTSDLSTKCVHLPSKAEIETTAPLDNGGKGTLFSPTDLLATALGSCAITVMAKYAENEGISFKGSRVKVAKIMQKEPRKVIQFNIDFNLPQQIDAGNREKLQEIARSCPAVLSLNPDITFNFSFTYE